MNVRCPKCDTTFRVDPERIPAAGIKARCSRCSAIFELTRTGVKAEGPAPAAAGAGPARAPASEPPRPPEASRAPVPAQAPAPAAAHAPAPAPALRPIRPLPDPGSLPPVAQQATESEAAAAPPPASPKRASFRNQDPGARAQRLARALVSDIVAYNKERVEKAQTPAQLRTEFREEIRKSWEEYVEQVGLEMARSSPYFRDALNEILAKGQKVF